MTTQVADTTDPRVGTTFTHDGWSVRVHVEPDYDNSTDDDEGLTASQIAAYNRGDWSYVGLVVNVSREDIELGSFAVVGIEEGFFTYTDEDDNVTGQGYVGPYTEAVDDCIAEAIAEAQATLARLCGGVK